MISEDNEARLPTLKLSVHKRSTQGRLGRSETASCTVLVLLPSCLETQRKGHWNWDSHWCCFCPSQDILSILWAAAHVARYHGGLLGKRDSTGFKLPSCVSAALCTCVCKYHFAFTQLCTQHTSSRDRLFQVDICPVTGDWTQVLTPDRQALGHYLHTSPAQVLFHFQLRATDNVYI